MQDLLDLDRYPLHRPETEGWTALVARCRRDLEATGMFTLHGFMRPAAAAGIAAALAPRFATEAFHHRRSHNIWFAEDPPLPPGHAALTRLETSNRTLCADQMGETPLPALHRWPPLARFLAAAMDKPALYPMADPLAGVNAMAYGPGEALNWHFDRSEFTTTLLLQAPDAGGEFEYRTALRSAEDPNYEGVARLLRGQDPGVRRLALAAGALNVFRGANTAHRVTPAAGEKPRVIAVFSYFDRPGVVFSEAERRSFYGRAG